MVTAGHEEWAAHSADERPSQRHRREAAPLTQTETKNLSSGSKCARRFRKEEGERKDLQVFEIPWGDVLDIRASR